MLSIFSLLIGYFCIFFRVFLSPLPIFFRDFLVWIFFFKSLLTLLQHCFCFTFWFFGSKAGGISAPDEELNPNSLYWKVLDRQGIPSLPFFKLSYLQAFFLLLFCCECYLYTLFWCPSLIRYMIWKYFFPFCGWSFPSLDSILWRTIALWVPAVPQDLGKH